MGRLNLFGITGAATMNHPSVTGGWSYRLNLFGITGAATMWTLRMEGSALAASISLESRVLRRAIRGEEMSAG